MAVPAVPVIAPRLHLLRQLLPPHHPLQAAPPAHLKAVTHPAACQTQAHPVILPIPVRAQQAAANLSHPHQPANLLRHHRTHHPQVGRTVNRVSRHSLVLPAHRVNQANHSQVSLSQVSPIQLHRFPVSRNLTPPPTVEACHEVVNPIRSQVDPLPAVVAVVRPAVVQTAHQAPALTAGPIPTATAFQVFQHPHPATPVANVSAAGSGHAAGS